MPVLVITAILHCNDIVRGGMSDISASASKADTEVTTVILSRLEYLRFVPELSLHYVFRLVCLCVLNSIKSLKRGDES